MRYADHKFTQAEQEIGETGSSSSTDLILEYQARGVFYLPEKARFQHLLDLPEGEDIARAINDAMRMIERENSQLDGVLPKTYNQLERSVLFELLRTMAQIPMDIKGDAFGKIYEYFWGQLCDGSMFVQSAEFIHNHRQNGNNQISIYGTEQVAETIRLCKMNLAVHGLEGDIRQANSYYEDPHRCLDRFDFVMANPSFNVNRVDRERIKDAPRFPFGMPRTDNANYLWIQLFLSALNPSGRAGFVMTNDELCR